MRSVVIDTADYDWEGDRPLNRPMSETIIYEMHVGGFTQVADVGRQAPRHVRRRRSRRSRTCRRSASPRSNCCRSSSSTRREVRAHEPGRRAAAQLLGLQHGRLLRAALRLLRRAGAGRAPHRVPRHGQGAAQGRHRGDPRRRVQPHRRGQPPGPDDQLQGPRQRRLLPPRPARPAVLHGLLGLRQHGQLQPPDRRRSSSSSACEYWVSEMHVDGFRFDEGSILRRGEDGAPMAHPPVDLAASSCPRRWRTPR